MLLSLAQRFHAFSGSSLQTYTMPTLGASSNGAGSVQVVQEPAALETITQFLGTSPGSVVTPPLDAYGSPVPVPSSSTTPSRGTGTGASGTTTTTTTPG